MKNAIVIGSVSLAVAAASASARAQQPTNAPTTQQSSSVVVPAPKNWTAAEDHQNMMEQLGIKTLRPGPSGNEQAPNHANYDEALANPYPKLPEVLTLANGRKVTTPRMWARRRAEIVEAFEREVYGRVP